jgi:hypothetical protein
VHAGRSVCISQWVGEMIGFADQAHVKGCVIQVTVPRYVKPDILVQSFTQEELDSFFILVSGYRTWLY